MGETLRNERKLLKHLISISTDYSNNQIPISNVKGGIKNYYLNQLIQKDFVTLDFQNQDDEGNPIFDFLVVTQEGQHFFVKNREEIQRFFYRSIFTPIIVSSLTTLLTLFITWLIKTVIAK